MSLLCGILATSLSLAGDGSGPAPNFSLASLSGKPVALNQLRGQVVMINFSATWCGPCRQEMPLLEQMYRKYKPMGFTLLGVNVEPDPNGAANWLKETPVSFPILLDRENQVSKLYNVSLLTSVFAIEKDRKACAGSAAPFGSGSFTPRSVKPIGLYFGCTCCRAAAFPADMARTTSPRS